VVFVTLGGIFHIWWYFPHLVLFFSDIAEHVSILSGMFYFHVRGIGAIFHIWQYFSHVVVFVTLGGIFHIWWYFSHSGIFYFHVRGIGRK